MGNSPDAQGTSTKNTPFDRAVALLTLLVTLTIALIGFRLTSSDQRARNAQNTLDTLVRTLQLNASTNPAEQRAGNALLTYMDDSRFLAVFDPELVGNQSYKQFIASVRSGVYAQQNQGVVVSSPKISSAEQWIYLGEHTAGGWHNPTLNFAPTAGPESLVNESYKVLNSVGTVNVRSGPPLGGQQGLVVNQIEPDQTVTLDRVHESTPGFWWGKLRVYNPKTS